MKRTQNAYGDFLDNRIERRVVVLVQRNGGAIRKRNDQFVQIGAHVEGGEGLDPDIVDCRRIITNHSVE